MGLKLGQKLIFRSFLGFYRISGRDACRDIKSGRDACRDIKSGRDIKFGVATSVSGQQLVFLL